MKFRPCIDIHNGKVKQIVGGSLKDRDNQAVENYISEYDAAYYARMYQKDGVTGGHVILLNATASEYFQETKRQAMQALRAYPGGLQIGGGICDDNAAEYLNAGASHVIVTSYVFQEGQIQWENLKKLVKCVGKDKVVLDLSCRKKNGRYYVVTNRWQTYTDEVLNPYILETLSEYCDEFLIHGVDVEGKASGIEDELVSLLATWEKNPITYAGGIGTMEDLKHFSKVSERKLDFTIGSALDLFGGNIPYKDVIKM